MFETLDAEAVRATPEAQSPSLLYTLTELPRTLLEVGSLALSTPFLAGLPKGDGHPVMVLPGFMAGDESTLVLRRYLKRLGYQVHAWDLGRNSGKLDLIQTRLPARFEALQRRYEQPISLVGQSLGGVFSRELARQYPGQVRQVITLGSPIALSDAHAVNGLVSRLFEQSAGLEVEAMREAVGDVSRKPEVPITAIYSKGDGIVHWQGCREAEEDATTQNIEVYGSHCGMAHNPAIFSIIADRLAQKAGEWSKFDTKRLGCLIP